MLVRSAGLPSQSLRTRVTLLGSEIATKVAAKEEEIWVCDYPQNLTVFLGTKKLFA
jgi:hypothetical protein